MKVIIIGGVAGGATAAARIRRLDETAEIVVFERSGYVSYATCGMPYYVGGVIEDPEELTLQTPESFHTRFRVDMRVRHEVQAIHPEKKSVTVRNLETGEEFEENYDKLILSPGARPTEPPVPGLELDRIFRVRTIEDTFRIKNYCVSKRPKSAVVAGGGFIGLEMAENLRDLGLEVTIVQRPKQLMNPLDPDMAAYVHERFEKEGVKLLLGAGVAGFAEVPEGIRVDIKDKESITADMVVLAIGVTPDTHLAKEAGLALGIKDSIVVNERMETSAPDIYAIGDAVQIKNYVTNEDANIALAGPAYRQARVAADNICGGDSVYVGAQGSSIFKLFDMTVAATGINEKQAQALGLFYDKVYLSPGNHAGYYPGSRALNMKVLYEKETYRILGAQIAGGEGADKRIDVIATAMHAGMSALRLKDLDLAYAPPYNAARDPVNMAGLMIDNIKNGKLRQYFYEDVAGLPRDGSVVLLDTRTEKEFERGHVDGFINIPVDELRERVNELPKDKEIYLMCQSGLRSYVAYRILDQLGFSCYNFSGGYRFYETVDRDRKRLEAIG